MPGPPGDVSAAPPPETSVERTPDAPPARPATPERYRGLWVLCEGSKRVLDDPGRIRQLVRDAAALGATDLFVQVYRGGRAWYDAKLADPAPYRAIRSAGDPDPLDLLLELAHAEQMRVHAWVNVLSLNEHLDSPLIEKFGRDAILVDRRGRSLLDYPSFELPEPDAGWYRMGTRGLYLDPATPGLAEHLAAVFSELIALHPGLDGLHLDYIRHPGVLPFVPGSRFDVGIDFGYGPASRARFQRETGLRAPHPDDGRFANANRWDDWRREKVDELVAQIRSASRAAAPGLLLSAAVNSYVDRAYLSLAQDWRRWLEEGWLDFAVPMVYTLDDRLLRYQAEHFAGTELSSRIWPGVGVWLFAKNPARALRQLEIVRATGAPGDALFSYDAVADAPALLAALADARSAEVASASDSIVGESPAAPAHPDRANGPDGGSAPGEPADDADASDPDGSTPASDRTASATRSEP